MEGLDREDRIKGGMRELIVLAVDSGQTPLTASTTVRVKVLDVNDNAPKFSEPLYYLSVQEGSEYGTVVSNLSATDNDLDVNGMFLFKIATKDEDRVPFDVGPGGVIKVIDELDRENIHEYKFDVIVYDLGEPESLSSSVLVHISISDINDNSPFFTFPSDTNYTLSIPHTLSTKIAFGQIIAKDADEGKNAQLVYARDSGNGSKFFDVIPDTGEIVLVKELTLKDIGARILTVAVHDLGLKGQMATHASLQIIIYEGNATLHYRDDEMGFRNVVVVVVLIVVTVVLGVAILLTILLIRRVDKQRRLYNSKNAPDPKVDTMRNFSPVVGIDLETTGSSSDITSDSKDNGKKKKEVSFSLNDDNVNSASTSGSGMTSFASGSTYSEKYDPLSETERGALKVSRLVHSFEVWDLSI